MKKIPLVERNRRSACNPHTLCWEVLFGRMRSIFGGLGSDLNYLGKYKKLYCYRYRIPQGPMADLNDINSFERLRNRLVKFTPGSFSRERISGTAMAKNRKRGRSPTPHGKVQRRRKETSRKLPGTGKPKQTDAQSFASARLDLAAFLKVACGALEELAMRCL